MKPLNLLFRFFTNHRDKIFVKTLIFNNERIYMQELNCKVLKGHYFHPDNAKVYI